VSYAILVVAADSRVRLESVPLAPTSLAHPISSIRRCRRRCRERSQTEHVDLGWKYLQIDYLRGADSRVRSGPDRAIPDVSRARGSRVCGTGPA
jgi:hypothetical protein